MLGMLAFSVVEGRDDDYGGRVSDSYVEKEYKLPTEVEKNVLGSRAFEGIAGAIRYNGIGRYSHVDKRSLEKYKQKMYDKFFPNLKKDRQNR
jgi:hypothetical protein